MMKQTQRGSSERRRANSTEGRTLGFHYAYVILFFSMLNITGCLGFGRFSYTMILPAMRDGLGLLNTQMGLIGTIGFIGYLAMAIPGGMLAARFGHGSLSRCPCCLVVQG